MPIWSLWVCVCVHACVCSSHWIMVPLTLLNYSCVTSNQVCNISHKGRGVPNPLSECICSSACSKSRTLWLYLENWTTLFLIPTKEEEDFKNFFLCCTGSYGYNVTHRSASDVFDVLKMCFGIEDSAGLYKRCGCWEGCGRTTQMFFKDKSLDSCWEGRLLSTPCSHLYRDQDIVISSCYFNGRQRRRVRKGGVRSCSGFAASANILENILGNILRCSKGGCVYCNLQMLKLFSEVCRGQLWKMIWKVGKLFFLVSAKPQIQEQTWKATHSSRVRVLLPLSYSWSFNSPLISKPEICSAFMPTLILLCTKTQLPLSFSFEDSRNAYFALDAFYLVFI